jgi:hypothetical protein
MAISNHHKQRSDYDTRRDQAVSQAGDRLELIVERDGKMVLVPATVDVSELKGLLAPAPRQVKLEGMEAAIRNVALYWKRRIWNCHQFPALVSGPEGTGGSCRQFLCRCL